MNRLSRIFRRTPSLRTRVAFATAIAAAIVVGIVGTIVWVGITSDRKERLDRRLDEAAGWLLAAFAVQPLKRLAQQTRAIDVGGEAPDVDVRGATEAVEIAEAVNGMVQRIWEEQDNTKAALASARDFAAVTSHELR